MELSAAKASKELTALLQQRSGVQLKMGRLERSISDDETSLQNLQVRNETVQQKLIDLHRDTVTRNDVYHLLGKVMPYQVTFNLSIISYNSIN